MEMTIECQGDYWCLRAVGHTVFVRDSKGVRLLARLLREPGRDFLALELDSAADVAVESDPAVATPTTGPPEPPGEPVGARGLVSHRLRLGGLRASLEEAKQNRDPDRATRVRGEVERLVEEFSHAVGLGEPARPGSASERARVSVTKAIKDAIARVCEQDEVLGRSLAVAVRTGRFCCYEQPMPGGEKESPLAVSKRVDRLADEAGGCDR